jgi:Zn-dependent peptidase ImmA (M78 family)
MTRVTVHVKPELFRWASERAVLSSLKLREKFPSLSEWERGTKEPTLKQLEAFANATHTPIGFFFLQTPPQEKVPIPDFRTPGNAFVHDPSPDLLETIYQCQQRQDWYRDYVRSIGERPLSFVGSASTSSSVTNTASKIRDALLLDLDHRRDLGTWEEARRQLIEQADAIGVLVMVSGIVGSNTHRTLDPEEFRGFALADEIAPLIFVNGADTRSAQMFTIAHELAHLWLGKTALDDAQPSTTNDQTLERWCNQVAAEILAPLESVRREFNPNVALRIETERLARVFKVSTLVILRRFHDAGKLTQTKMWAAYREEVQRLQALEKKASAGGDFYTTQRTRVGRRFLRAIITSTLEGETLHRDAYRMLGISSAQTLEKLGEAVGVG